MLKPEQIPQEAMKAFYEQMAITINPREAVVAALNAWPEMQTGSDDGGMTLSGVYLPLTTQEPGE